MPLLTKINVGCRWVRIGIKERFFRQLQEFSYFFLFFLKLRSYPTMFKDLGRSNLRGCFAVPALNCRLSTMDAAR